MSTADLKAEVDELLATVTRHTNAHGAGLANRSHVAAVPILRWLDYLRNSESTNCCDEFLDGLRAALVETVCCITLGLVRPAIFSMRGQIDIALSWLYFKDHPVEWNRVQETGEGFLLKSRIIEYLSDNFSNFEKRFALLSANRRRKEPEPYKLLSAHVHSQNTVAVPKYGQMKTLIGKSSTCDQCVAMQEEVTEYIGDVFLSIYANKWASLPPAIVKEAKARLQGEKTAKLFW